MSSTRRSISYYTSTVPVERTVAEIQRLLAAAKASAILTELSDGLPVAISFRIKTEFGLLTFRLPANVEGVYAVLQRSRTIGPKFRTREQAARVAFRIILHWLDAQLAMIEARLVTLEQVFLPYCQDASGVTVYERLRERQFSDYLLPEKT